MEPYILKRNPYLNVTLDAAKSHIRMALKRLEDAAKGLEFEPEKHKYFLYGTELSSVSSVVEHFAPFDTAAKAAQVAANPRHPLFGKDVKEIIAIWEEKRDKAAAAGTKVHAFAEACFLFMCGLENEIEAEFRDRVKPEGLEARDPKEISVARWWNDQDWTRYVPVAKEVRLVNPECGYAGTFDLLLYDLMEEGFVLKDYKTNEDLHKWYGDMLTPPLNMLRADDVGKYTVQQTLYMIVLRLIGLLILRCELIWLKEDSYEDVPLDVRYDRVIAYTVKNYLKS